MASGAASSTATSDVVVAPAVVAVDECVGATPLTGDALHIDRLRSYYAANRPENVVKCEGYFQRLGKQIWNQIEDKYPGTTSEFTVVRCQVVR